MTKPFTVSAASIKLTPLDFDGNQARILRVIAEEKSKGVSLICFPELCLSGYGCEDAFFFPDVIARSEQSLKAVTEATKDIAVVVGFPFIFKSVRYNCAALLHNQNIVAIIPKQNLANDGIHYETRWFTPWQRGKKDFVELFGEKIPFGGMPVDLDDQKIGFEICEDAWVVDRPANAFKEQGVTIVVNPSASHFALRKYAVRLGLIREGSERSQAVYVYANQLGNEAGRAIYDGDAIIASKGTIVAATERFSFKEYTTCRYEMRQEKQEALKDIISYKASAEEQFEEFTKAAALGLYDYLKKSGAKRFVLSLSGGADSAAVLTLVQYMVSLLVTTYGLQEVTKLLGKEYERCTSEKEILSLLIYCVYQGTAQNSDSTKKAAKTIATSFGASFFEFSIGDEVQAYQAKVESIVGRTLQWATDDIALQNIQARVRAPGIWFLTNVVEGLLLTTGNRSEASVGYATMDGDTSGSLAPIAGVSKFFIKEWLKWVETKGLAPYGPKPFLSCITSQEPTAELRPLAANQTDEADLMPYEVLEFFERTILKNHTSVSEAHSALQQKFHERFSKEELTAWLDRFLQLWRTSQWKRERLAPSFHLDDFSVDSRTWLRYPILSQALSRK